MDCDEQEIEYRERQQKLNKVVPITNKNIKKKKNNIQKQQQGQSDGKSMECSICYCTIKDKGVIKDCEHTFCFKCIELWAKMKQTCPQCRATFSKINRIWKQGKAQKEKIYEFYPKEESSSSNSEDNLISLEVIMNTSHQLQFNFIAQFNFYHEADEYFD